MNKVYAAMAAVAAELSRQGISKDRKNQGQGFKFRGIDDVYGALSPLLVQHKLLLLPSVEEIRRDERASKQGGAVFHVTVTVRYSIVSTEDGSSVDVKVYGEGMDSGDKATSKALSIAFKYAAFQVFCIPVEGMPDPDEESYEVESKKEQPEQPKASPSRELFGSAEQAIAALAACQKRKDIRAWDALVHESIERGWVPTKSRDTLVTARRIRIEEIDAKKVGAG